MDIERQNPPGLSVFGNGKVVLRQPMDRFAFGVSHDHVNNDAVDYALEEQIIRLWTLRSWRRLSALLRTEETWGTGQEHGCQQKTDARSEGR
jgi:hypothetical protein